MMVAHRISHHHGKLFEAQLAITVLVCLHNRLVDDLLELCVLRGIVSSPSTHKEKKNAKSTKKADLQVVAHHHLEYEKQLAVGNEPITIHVVHLEGD